MTITLIRSTDFVPHPKFAGVFIKPCFGRAHTDRLNNMEVRIEPGREISRHVHPASTEFYYIVAGTGQYWDGRVWQPTQAGDAFQAPAGEEHGLRNTGTVPLLVFSTFTPPLN